MTIAAIDTNVIVAGLLTRQLASPVARILDGMLGADFPFALSQALLSEYRRVLLRPRIVARHRLDLDEIDLLLTDLCELAIVLQPSPASLVAPDPGDQHLWELLDARTDLLLVTGDRRLLQDCSHRERILLPAEFCARTYPPA